MLGSSFLHVNAFLAVTFTTHKPACVAGAKNNGRKKRTGACLPRTRSFLRSLFPSAGYAQIYFETEEKIAAAAPAVLPFSKMAVAQREATFSAL